MVSPPSLPSPSTGVPPRRCAFIYRTSAAAVAVVLFFSSASSRSTLTIGPRYSSTSGAKQPAAARIGGACFLEESAGKSWTHSRSSCMPPSKTSRSEKEPFECAVCLSEFKDYETLRLIPKCNHVFNPECIDAWLASQVTCSVCRANLNPDSDEVAVGVPSTQLNANELDEESTEDDSVSSNRSRVEARNTRDVRRKRKP